MDTQKIVWYIHTLVKRCIYGKIGKKSYFAKCMYVSGRKRIIIGNRCRIYPNSRIEVKKPGLLIIEDNCSIGQNVHIVSHDSELLIGESSTISSNVFISNVNHSFCEINKSTLEQKLIYEKTRIGKYCFIGTGAVIMPGVELGDNCIVGANSTVLRGKYDSFCMLVGNPARIIKRYNLDLKKWVENDDISMHGDI